MSGEVVSSAPSLVSADTVSPSSSPDAAREVSSDSAYTVIRIEFSAACRGMITVASYFPPATSAATVATGIDPHMYVAPLAFGSRMPRVTWGMSSRLTRIMALPSKSAMHSPRVSHIVPLILTGVRGVISVD